MSLLFCNQVARNYYDSDEMNSDRRDISNYDNLNFHQIKKHDIQSIYLFGNGCYYFFFISVIYPNLEINACYNVY